MPNHENQTGVFMVRLWLERREIDTGEVEWHGVVEHMPSRDRRYGHRLAMSQMMAPYLEGMGIEQDE